jgi:cell fate (sporulation/competence/biofilm development) regulator YlbF (YheA/YmcA/DUF963 family)
MDLVLNGFKGERGFMVYDHAYQLARSIRQSNEYKFYLTLQEKVNRDPGAQHMLDDFRKKQLDLQMRQFSGQSVPEEEIQQLTKLSDVMNLHEDINQLLEAEKRLGLMMDDVQRIISEPLKSIFAEGES